MSSESPIQPGGSASPHATPVPPEPPTPEAQRLVAEVKFTRAAALWSALITGLLILVVLLVFIVQNTESASMAFLGWHWTLPLGVQILLAAVSGALITVMVGAARIIQLRRAAKKNLRAAMKR